MPITALGTLMLADANQASLALGNTVVNTLMIAPGTPGKALDSQPAEVYTTTPYGVIVFTEEALQYSMNQRSLLIDFSRFAWDKTDIRTKYDVVFRDLK